MHVSSRYMYNCIQPPYFVIVKFNTVEHIIGLQRFNTVAHIGLQSRDLYRSTRPTT